MNDSLHPLPLRVEGPVDAAGCLAPESWVGSPDSDGVREKNELATRLEATKVAFHAAKEESSAARARLAEADATMAGEP